MTWADESTAGMSGRGDAGSGTHARALVLAALLESDADPVFSLDREYRYTSFNAAHAAAMKALYGADVELRHSLFEYQDVPEDARMARANLDRALAGEEVVDAAWSGGNEQTRRFFEVSHRPVRDDGRVAGVLVVARDLTQQQHDRAAVKLRERALEESISAIALADLEGRLSYVNRSFLRLWGYDRLEEVIGREATEFWESVEDAEAVRRTMLEAGSWSGQLGAVRRDGAVFPVELTTSLVTDDDGSPVGALAAFVDISSRLAAEHALRAADEMLSRAQRSARAGLWEWDLVADEYIWSPELYALFGVAVGEDTGASWARLLHPDDRARVEAALAVSLAEGQGFREQFRIVRPDDGGELWIESVGDVVRDGDGRTLRLTGLCMDVTERRRMEEALRESEVHLRAFFEGASIGMATTSPEKGWLEVNDALCSMLGYRRDELAHLTWSELTYPDDLAADVAQFERLTAGDIDGYAMDKRFVRKDGSVVHTHLVVHAVRRSGPPGFDHVAAMLEDITDRVRAQEELRRLNAELEQRVETRTAQLQAANREMEAFAYSISHDLRAPLRALDGFSEILAEDYTAALDEEGHAHLARIRAAAQRMGQLIDALLALSRLSRRELSVEEVDLSALARRLGERLRRAEPGRTVELTVQPGCTAATDAGLVEVLLGDLLDNAWKFTAARDPAHVEIGSLQTAEETVFYVRDDGAGFDMTYVDKLFQPFQRLHAAQDYPGTGIGLASVRRIVARLGGRCWAEGSVGEGAAFFFTLGEPAAD